MTTEPTLREAIAAAIIGNRMSGLGGARDHVEAILAATYPPACPTCKGTGLIDGGWSSVLQEIRRDPCPDCPTIGKLLAIGVAVMTNSFAVVDGPSGDDLIHEVEHAYWAGSDACWQALRAVEP